MHIAKLLTLLAVAGVVAACDKPQTAAEATPPAAAAPATAASPRGEAVDTCALLEAEAAAQAIGALATPPEAQTPQGSLLGGCNYMGAGGIVMLTARPADEYAATVDYAASRGAAKAIDDLPGIASLTSAGLMLQPAGKPYFLVVYPLIGGAFDESAALQLARALKL